MTQETTRTSSRIKQRIINWLLADEETYVPRTKFGRNTMTVGSDLVDDTNANTVYDTSAQQFGSGNESADLSSVTTDEINGGVTGSLSVGKIMGERIESQSPSGVSEADFTTGIGSDYDRYIFELTDVVPATNGAKLFVRVRTSGGSFNSGASDYSFAHHVIDSSGTEANQSQNGVSEIEITQGFKVGSAAGEGLSATVRLSNPANASLLQLVQYETAYIESGNGDLTMTKGSGSYDTAEAIDGVRFTFDSGNIESGDIDLYGVMG